MKIREASAYFVTVKIGDAPAFYINGKISPELSDALVRRMRQAYRKQESVPMFARVIADELLMKMCTEADVSRKK